MSETSEETMTQDEMKEKRKENQWGKG
jgi:hypothetical protein